MIGSVIVGIITGIICSFIYGQFCFGIFAGFFFGSIAGILCSIIIKAFLARFNNDTKMIYKLSSMVITIAVTASVLYYVSCPSPSRIFQSHILSPIPTEVSEIAGKHYNLGPDVADVLKFNAPPEIFNRIISSKNLKKQEHFEINEYSLVIHRTDQGYRSISFPCRIDWLGIEKIKSPKVFYKEGEWEFEYLIYDPDNQKTYYYYFTI